MTTQIKLTTAAQQNVEETSTNVEADLAALRSGLTAEQLLAQCLTGADEDRIQGWRDYVDALTAATDLVDDRAEQLQAIRRRAVNSASRAIDSLDLTRDEADDLGEETLAWLGSRLGLVVTETDDGVEIRRA